MTKKWFYSVVTMAALTAPAWSQVGIYIGRTPPPMRREVRPPMPGDGYSWVEGYWNWSGNRYVWMPGRWNRPPFQGAYWSHPHYDHEQQGWQMHEGHWDHEDHSAPQQDYRGEQRGGQQQQDNRGGQRGNDQQDNHGNQHDDHGSPH